MERALVRRRRAGVRGARRSGSAGGRRRSARSAAAPARHAGERPDVVAVLGEAGHEIGPRDRSEPDHEVVAVEPAAASSRPPVRQGRSRGSPPRRRGSRAGRAASEAGCRRRSCPIPTSSHSLRSPIVNSGLRSTSTTSWSSPSNAFSSTAAAIPPKPPPRTSVRALTTPAARGRRPRPRSARTCRRTPAPSPSAP